MRNSIVILIIAVILFGAAATSAQRRHVIGDLRFEKLKSEVFGNTRTLRILVPKDYRRNKSRKYKVLFLNDGQNLFQINTAQGEFSEWGVDETIDDLESRKRIEPIIVVGIDNPGKALRDKEYLPWSDKSVAAPLINPEGAKYPDFIVNEVIPFVESKYRVKKGVANRAIGGAGNGALISLYTVLMKPGIFGGLILESPNLQVDFENLIAKIDTAEILPRRIHIGVGTNEENLPNCVEDDLSQQFVKDVSKLKEALIKRGISESEMHIVIEECASRSEIAYGRRLYEAIIYLFPRDLKNSIKK